MNRSRIAKIEWGQLEGQRPRSAGSNARLGDHGSLIRLPLLRLTLEDGVSGWGAGRIPQEQAARILGLPLDSLFSAQVGVLEAGRAVEYPLWDVVGKARGLPVYALAAGVTERDTPISLSAPCYDTSLYFDDLHLESTEEAARLLAAEAREGWERGHRAFKIKVGRGARHLPLEAGTARDIVIVQAVRAAVGGNIPLMLDANNGYNLNLTKRVLSETANCNIYWLEEAFHEDPILYRDLKGWLAERNLAVLIADGEGDASPALLTWAKEGLIDVVQYDIFGYGFTRWLQTAKQLDAWNVRSAPHHYGGHFGNYAACHLAAAIQNFTFVEWDEAATPGLDASAYRIEEGQVHVPNAPGFGLALDEGRFRHAVETTGGELKF